MSQPSAIITLACDELPWPYTRESCSRCPSRIGYLARIINRNGVNALRWVCEWCENYATIGPIAHAFLAPYGVPISRLPVRADNREVEGPECAVCGSLDVEYHHWAPRAIFPELEWAWVAEVPLCPTHHRQWHDRMREHGLRWPHELASAT